MSKIQLLPLVHLQYQWREKENQPLLLRGFINSMSWVSVGHHRRGHSIQFQSEMGVIQLTMIQHLMSFGCLGMMCRRASKVLRGQGCSTGFAMCNLHAQPTTTFHKRTENSVSLTMQGIETYIRKESVCMLENSFVGQM